MKVQPKWIRSLWRSSAVPCAMKSSRLLCFCKACLQQFWKTKNTQECPVCRRRSSKQEPPYNLALKNLCESFLRDRRESSPEDVCSVHREKLKLFCLKDKEPVCLVCRDSQKHASHTFQPIDEVLPSYKVGLDFLLFIYARSNK